MRGSDCSIEKVGIEKALFLLRKNPRFGLRPEIAHFDPPFRLHKNWPKTFTIGWKFKIESKKEPHRKRPKTKCYSTALWLVHHLCNMVPKKMCAHPVWRPMLLHYVPKMWTPNNKGCLAAIWRLRVARTIRHHLVAAFYCSANIYHNVCPGTIYENDTHNLYVWRIPALYTRTIRTIFLILLKYVFLAIGTSVAQPLALGDQIDAKKKKESQSGTITLGLTPEIVARILRHHLVAEFCCSANM